MSWFGVMALLHSAQAYVIPCVPVGISDTLPAHEQTNVPVDAQITLIADNQCPVGSSSLNLDVTLETGGEVVEETQITIQLDREGGVGSFRPSSPLLSGTNYRLTIVDEAAELSSEVLFTTGMGTVAELSGDLDVSVTDAWWTREPEKMQIANFSVSVGALPDPDDMSTLHLFSDSDVLMAVQRADSSGELQDIYGSVFGPAARDTCVFVEQHDGTGKVVAVSETICPDIPRYGCNMTSTGASWWTMAWLPLVGLVRRRSR